MSLRKNIHQKTLHLVLAVADPGRSEEAFFPKPTGKLQEIMHLTNLEDFRAPILMGPVTSSPY